MLTREVLRQVRRLQLRARRAVEDPLGGAYRSVFKGSGIAFEEVREYQPGDEIRSIDWNVTARMGHPFIKRYIEERELTVVFLMDASASMTFGSVDQAKRDVVAEIAALLALCAVSNNDKIGLLLATSEVERFVPPRKGPRHALRIIRDLFVHSPRDSGTNLQAGLDYLNKVLKRRALIFVCSDFLDAGYEKAMQRWHAGTMSSPSPFAIRARRRCRMSGCLKSMTWRRGATCSWTPRGANFTKRCRRGVKKDNRRLPSGRERTTLTYCRRPLRAGISMS
jgi:hypothetical protein